MTPSGKSAIAIIPARGGSKGLPGKNIKPLCGHPLIAWTITAAHTAGLFDAIVVSTDSEEIAAVAKEYGALTCRRPPELSGDAALVKDAVRHCLSSLEPEFARPDYIFLLQPTSPQREPEDILACLAALEANGADSAASFRPAEEPLERAFRIEAGIPTPALPGADGWLPRQALPACYYLNGAVYVVATGPFLADPSASFLFGRMAASVMPPERSLDIDTPLQFRITEMLMAEQARIDPSRFRVSPLNTSLFDFPR